jgi:hypothetical protein
MQERDISSEFMNIKEVAKYLDIHKKQDYLFIKAGKIPCGKKSGITILGCRQYFVFLEKSSIE